MNSHQRRAERRLVERIRKELASDQGSEAARETVADPSKSVEPRRPLLISGAVLLLIIILSTTAYVERQFLSVDGWINVTLLALIPFAMGWAGIYLAARVLKSPREKWAFISLFTVAFVIGIGLALVQQKRSELALAKARHRHTLTKEEREAFKNALKGQATGDLDVQLACPTGDERACLFADQFINIFGESGWKVDPSILRMTMNREREGVIVYRRGGNKEYLSKHWDAGGYFAINEPHLLAVQSAFHSIHIEIDGGTNPDLGENTMVVYVGSERENEAEPTSLTKSTEWLNGKRQGPFPSSVD